MHEHEYVVVPLTEGTLWAAAPDGAETAVELSIGQSYVRPAGTAHTIGTAAPPGLCSLKSRSSPSVDMPLSFTDGPAYSEHTLIPGSPAGVYGHEFPKEGHRLKMNIRDQWDHLDPATQKWLTDNPGCLILPRTVTATICNKTGTDEGNRHGETVLSQEDRDFIRLKATEAQDAPRERPFFPADQS